MTNETLLNELTNSIGADRVFTGTDMARWSENWNGEDHWTPLAVLRPRNTAEVATAVKLANAYKTPIVPISGNTGLTGGTRGGGALMVSLDRMSDVREIHQNSRVAVVEAGAILSKIHDAVDEHDLIFPLYFGARGSAMIGGCLSTNAGGSNVLRYGNVRELCLGLEVVTPTGEIMDLMAALPKNNTGYDLRHLMIGAEGTLGIITAAVLRLFPKPLAHATALLAAPSINDALMLLNRLQAETSGAVEAFEYMPGEFIDAYREMHPDKRLPLEERHEVNILVELAATSKRDAELGQDGSSPIVERLETALMDGFEAGQVIDAVIAKSETERAAFWHLRESAAELSTLRSPEIGNDIAVPLDRMQELVENANARARELDPGIDFIHVAHLGDGNLHFAAWPSSNDAELHRKILFAVEEQALALGGTFSAEHGIGLSKKPAMVDFKDPVALDTMRAIKTALDPNNILNPGKVIP